MSSVLIIFGGGGGMVAVLGAIIIIGRGIFRQVTATEENTAALNILTGRVELLMQEFSGLDRRVAILEDRMGRVRW